jgi:surfeit locus 1 family protein
MTPFRLAGGGVVWIDRGYIPESAVPDYAESTDVSTEQQTLAGIALPAEVAGPFTPAPDAAHRIDWTRDPARLAKMLDPALAPVAPIYVDLPADPSRVLPQGGETEVDFPNNHFGYALTWFGFAIITPVLLAYWVVRQLRPKAKEQGQA